MPSHHRFVRMFPTNKCPKQLYSPMKTRNSHFSCISEICWLAGLAETTRHECCVGQHEYWGNVSADDGHDESTAGATLEIGKLSLLSSSLAGSEAQHADSAFLTFLRGRQQVGIITDRPIKNSWLISTRAPWLCFCLGFLIWH